MELYVYRGNIKMGLLDITANEPFFGFTYNPEYLDLQGALPLSLSLPFTTSRYPASLTQPYFEGLLPEGEARDIITRRLGIPRNSSVKLLQALGHDCAGDITIIDEVKHSVYVQDSGKINQYVYMDSGIKKIAQKPHEELSRLQEDMRLSLAGGQEKTALYHDPGSMIEDGWYIPSHGSPSTHIIKPGLLEAHYPNVTLNEYLCLRAAAACGIPTANVFLLYPETPVIIIQRYDRIVTDTIENGFKTVTRIHQEDFCQACGIKSDFKYEHDDGPGFKQIRDILSKYAKHPFEDIKTLVKWAVFNYLTGNCDAHAKNLSLLHNTDSTVSLAPVYDLISSTIYDGSFGSKLNRGMAMKIGVHENIDKINVDDINIFARDVQIRLQQVKTIGNEIAEKLPHAFAVAAGEAEKLGFSDAGMMADRIMSGCNKRKVLF